MDDTRDIEKALTQGDSITLIIKADKKGRLDVQCQSGERMTVDCQNGQVLEVSNEKGQARAVRRRVIQF